MAGAAPAAPAAAPPVPPLLRLGAGAATATATAPPVAGWVALYDDRVRWEPEDAATGAAPIEILLAAIQAHQRSKAKAPGGRARVRLAAGPQQVLFLDFVAEADRNAFSDAVTAAAARLAAEDAPPAPGEAAARAVLLEHDAELRALYESLVGGGAVSEADFWRGRRQRQLLDEAASAAAAKRKGPAKGLVDVRLAADGRSSAVHVRINAEVITQIFTEKPAVLGAYNEKVAGGQMEMADFWSRYFKLEYLRQFGAAAAGSGVLTAADEQFAALLSKHEAAAAPDARQRSAALRRVDPTVNLAADEVDRLSAGYGLLRGGTREAEPAGAGPGTGADGGGASAAARLAHEVNAHAAIVMGAVQGGEEDGGNAAAEGGRGAGGPEGAAAAAPGPSSEGGSAPGGSKRPAGGPDGGADAAGAPGPSGAEALPPDGEAAEFGWARRVRRREAAALEDLTAETVHLLAPFELRDPRVYFLAAAGAAPPSGRGTPTMAAAASGSAGGGGGVSGGAGPRRGGHSLREALEGVDLYGKEALLPPAAARAALEEAHRAAARASRAASGAGRGPGSLAPAARAELAAAARAARELLRQFWASVPLTTARRVAKAGRIEAALKTLYDQLQAAQGRLPDAQRHRGHLLLAPVAAAMDAAFERFDAEHERLRRAGAAAASPAAAMAAAAR